MNRTQLISYKIYFKSRGFHSNTAKNYYTRPLQIHHQFSTSTTSSNLAIPQTGHNDWSRSYPDQTAWGIQW